jgi:MYXO-CTERM domain-containing protein
LIGAVVLVLAETRWAPAALVSGWGLETGFANATLTEGAAGSFSTTTPTGNAAPRAVLASPISLASIGSAVRLSGVATLQNTLGNQQFRFGLWNTNGHAAGTLSSGVWTGGDPNGWLGYMTQIGNNGGTNVVRGRGATGAWLSNTGAYDVGSNASTSSPAGATPYSFSLRLTRTGATSVEVSYSFVGGTENRSGTFTDNNLGPSAAMSSVNAVGFLLNANTGSGTFSDVDVSAVPEPASLWPALLGAAGLRRRRH